MSTFYTNVPDGPNASPAEENGKVWRKPMWARTRELETDKADLKPPFMEPGWQGVHREVGSKGHEAKYRAAIDEGNPDGEPVGPRNPIA
jgi:hypothetical protein